MLREEVHPDLVAERTCISNFIDDALLTGGSEEEFKRVLTSYFIDISNAGLLVSAKKFAPFQIVEGKGFVKFLGLKVSHDSYQPLDERLDALEHMDYPSCKKQLMRLLGLMLFLSEAVDSFMTTAKILYARLKGLGSQEKFTLSADEKLAVDSLKERILKAPPLNFALDPDDLIFLEVDSSSDACAGILYCVAEDTGLCVTVFRLPARG